jgi:hypothetical protein
VHPQNESFKSIGNNVGKKIPHSNRSTTDLQRPWLISVEDKPDLNLINQCEVDFVLKTSFMAESRGKNSNLSDGGHVRGRNARRNQTYCQERFMAIRNTES